MRISDWSSDVCSSDLPFPPERPGDRLAPRDTGDLLAEMALKHRSPRHKCELPALLNESEPNACQIDVTAIDTLDPLVRVPLDVVQAELPRELAGHTRQLPPAQEPEHVGAVDDPIRSAEHTSE